MRRAAIFLFALVLGLFSLFGSDDNSVFFYDYGRPTTINLNMDFYPPRYNTGWGKYAFNEGAYNDYNWLGLIGMKTVPHQVKVTISTGNGRFVSQSDPTKYRDFYIAIKPVYRYNGDYPYYRDITDSSLPDVTITDRVPTTKGANTLTVYFPVYSSGDSVYVGNNTYVTLEYFYYDILLCLDVAAADDYMHMAELDDYVAEITISWECLESGCSAHSGSSVMLLNGSYDSSNPKDSKAIKDTFSTFLTVNPTAEASRINIKQLLTDSTVGKAQIAELSVNTMYDSSTWVDNVMVFISSSSNYNSQGSAFKFVNVTTGKEIPFTVEVFDSSAGGNWTGTPNKSYDGTNYYVSYNSSKSMCLDLSGSQQTSKNRANNTTYYQVLFSGEVVLSIDDTSRDIYNNMSDYAGQYVSNIYYHLVYAN